MKINDIAKLAGVSTAAVSRYLNGGSISEEKKQKIKKVIDETGYVPNVAARILRRQQSGSIGIIVPRVNSDSVSNLIEGVSSIITEAGYLAIFGNTGNNEKREIEYLRKMAETKIAGIILMGTVYTPEHEQFFRESTLPIVVCGQDFPSVSCIYHDDLHAAKEITRYLISKGRKNLAFVGVNEIDKCVGECRRIGVEEAVKEANLGSDSLVMIQGGFKAEDGYEKMHELLENGCKPDGVVCATDSLAAGAMKALRDSGYRVPEDIGVVGIGGGSIGNIMNPSLTTVQLFHRQSGERAAKLLLSMIDHYREKPDTEYPVTHTMLGYNLIERNSV